MKLHRNALGAALLASAFAGGAYAGNYSDSTDAAQAHRSNPVSAEQQQQFDRSSTTTTAPSGQSSTVPSGKAAPSNAANERDFQALDRNHDGVISPDERKQLKPDTNGNSGTSSSTGSDASGTQPYQGPGSSADKAPENTGNPTPGSMSRPPAER